MNTYLILIRGINVGGKNKIPMTELKQCLEALGYSHVATYLASGNVLVRTDQRADEIQSQLEAVLPQRFALGSERIRVLALPQERLQAIVNNKPAGFGEQPETYHSDAIFLLGIAATEALPVFHPRAGVDLIWPGDGVIYSQRLSALRTKSRLSAIVGTPEYQCMTIRSWSTTTTLLDKLSTLGADTGLTQG